MRLHAQAINEGQIKDSEVLALVETRIIEVGTAMPFYQAAAPTGWTKDTTAALNDAALRLTTGTGGGTGGADLFNTLFGTSKVTDSHTLAESEMPAHTHSISPNEPTYLHDSGGALGAGTAAWSNVTFPTSTNSTGGGGGHTHNLLNMNLKFVDFIICSRDAV
jgi:microcystin-dependent protein